MANLRGVAPGRPTRTPRSASWPTSAACSWGQGRICFGNCTRRSHAERVTRVGSMEERVVASLERDRGLAAMAMVVRRTRRAEATARAVEMYSKSITTPPIGSCMADLFAGLIAEDMHKLAASKVREFSLAAKWCPSLDSSYDHSTLICEAVARRLFPRDPRPSSPRHLFPKGSAPELAAPPLPQGLRARARRRPRRRALRVPRA
jgi:hypothetical protein